MPKSIKFVNLLALWVFCIFTFAMICTYFSEWLTKIDFFGDKYTDIAVSTDFTPKGTEHIIWGARHYWYNWMCFVLFILSIVRVCTWADWYWSDKNKS